MVCPSSERNEKPKAQDGFAATSASLDISRVVRSSKHFQVIIEISSQVHVGILFFFVIREHRFFFMH